MTRDDGWRFLSLGRHLERLLFVATTLGDVAPDQASAGSGAARMAARPVGQPASPIAPRYMQQPEWRAVVDLLLFDGRNPRSARVPAREARQARPTAARGRLDELLGGDGAAARTLPRRVDGDQGDCSPAASGGSRAS